MNRIISRGLMTVLVTGGFLALGAGVAYADDTTDGSDGILSGTQGLRGIDLPVNVGGNALSVLGDSSSSGSSTSSGSGGAAVGVHWPALAAAHWEGAARAMRWRGQPSSSRATRSSSTSGGNRSACWLISSRIIAATRS